MGPKALFALGLLLFAVNVHAKDRWTPDAYPNPNKDVFACNRRGVASWICDPDAVITYESANVVEGLIKKILQGDPPYARAPCGDSAHLVGFQVAVALMRKMRVSGDAGAYAEEFAKALHDRWGVGDPTCNNGVLMLLSLEDRQLFISTGAGSVSRLSYGVLGNIIDDVKPALRAGRYDEAVERAVVDIGLALAGRPVEPQGGGGGGKDEWFGLVIFCSIVGAFVYFGSRGERQKRQRYQDCRSKLEKLKRDQAALRANSYNPTSCPVCLEDFSPDPDAPAGGEGSPGSAGGSGSGNGSGSAAAGGAGASCSHGHAHGAEKESEEELKKPLMSGGGGGSTAALGVSGSPTAAAAGAAAGAGAAAAGGAEAGAGGAGQRRPLVLPCGHAFCEPCIAAWLDQKKVTCPICRRPIDDEDPANPGANPADPTAPRPPGTQPRTPGDGGSGPGGSGGMGAGPSGFRPPCTVDDDDDAAAAAAAAASYGSRSHMGMGMGGGLGMGGGFGATSGPTLRLRFGNNRFGRHNRFGRARLNEDMLMMELLFRLRQLQRQHPEYVTPTMLSAWEQDLQNGREFSAQQLRDFQLRDPATRAALAQSGRQGSGVHFGGGSSRGGGGRGSSW